eukprot:TRINITY_DN1770_c0_g1_i1.p1 TRINITY_DN1770_c0_g1~~TRINITY_DN1770_c0_g1_i1.p1  ORF type:complete len:148 (+),score=18.18 TRINITY_DN1770_c0_g1_i1:62-445(+)
MASNPGPVINNGTWQFQANREWDKTSLVGHPREGLQDANYTKPSTASYRVDVTDGGSRVAVGDKPFIGVRSDDGTYELGEGTFAGGRFVVKGEGVDAAGGLQAELTIYGSGVPIISSVRGAFFRSST